MIRGGTGGCNLHLTRGFVPRNIVVSRLLLYSVTRSEEEDGSDCFLSCQRSMSPFYVQPSSTLFLPCPCLQTVFRDWESLVSTTLSRFLPPPP